MEVTAMAYQCQQIASQPAILSIIYEGLSFKEIWCPSPWFIFFLQEHSAIVSYCRDLFCQLDVMLRTRTQFFIFVLLSLHSQVDGMKCESESELIAAECNIMKHHSISEDFTLCLFCNSNIKTFLDKKNNTPIHKCNVLTDKTSC